MKQGTRLYINLTNKCNTNCPFCCMFSSTDNSIFMSFNTYKNIIDTCIGSFELQLEGGEPLLHKDIYLFIEYAVSTQRCTKVNILTNGFLLEKNLKRILSICKWYKIPFEIKISVNYWLIKEHKDHIADISKICFATEYIENFSISLNIRKRTDVDEWIDDEIKKYKLTKYANSYYLQSYGKLKDSAYSKPVIVQNIDNWRIYACDGKCFNQDLIARSEYESSLRG